MLRSRSRKEPQHFVGALAAIRCGSGSEGFGSKLDAKHGEILKKM
jgi:hypothetical protein